MNKNQKGFAVLESLLILIIIVTIGGIGWYAIHTKHQTDKILAQADKISQSTPVSTTKSTDNSLQKYLTIKEWGVKIPLGSPDQDMYYTSGKNSSYFNLKLHSLDSESDCTDSDLSVAAIVKKSISEYQQGRDGPIGLPDGVTIKDSVYFIETAQYACTQDTAKMALLGEARTEFKGASTKIIAE